MTSRRQIVIFSGGSAAVSNTIGIGSQRIIYPLCLYVFSCDNRRTVSSMFSMASCHKAPESNIKSASSLVFQIMAAPRARFFGCSEGQGLEMLEVLYPFQLWTPLDSSRFNLQDVFTYPGLSYPHLICLK